MGALFLVTNNLKTAKSDLVTVYDWVPYWVGCEMLDNVVASAIVHICYTAGTV